MNEKIFELVIVKEAIKNDKREISFSSNLLLRLTLLTYLQSILTIKRFQCEFKLRHYSLKI